jgi:hypothetical protein
MPDIPALEACAATTLRSRSGEGDRFTLRDDRHHDRKLVGSWLPMFHKTWQECEAEVESSEPPRVQATGGKYALVPKPAGE